MFTSVSIWGIVVAALSAMVVGTLWYSPALFGKEWSKITGITEKQMKEKRASGVIILIIVSFITAYALSLLITYLHAFTNYSWFAAGMFGSLLAGIGFGVTAIVAHGVFDTRSKKLLCVNAGNRIATFLVMGLIIYAFAK